MTPQNIHIFEMCFVQSPYSHDQSCINVLPKLGIFFYWLTYLSTSNTQGLHKENKQKVYGITNDVFYLYPKTLFIIRLNEQITTKLTLITQ